MNATGQYASIRRMASLHDDGGGLAQPLPRIFRLQQGESAQLRGVTGASSHLYLRHGVLSVLEANGTQSRFRATDPKFNAFDLGPGDEINVYALEDCCFSHVDTEMLDGLVSWGEIAGSLDGEEDREWLLLALECPVLRTLPLEVVYQLVSQMEHREVHAGDEVIHENDDGSDFYLIAQGSAEVWRRGEFGGELRRVATLEVGDGFGEEALVTGARRNATVRMIEDGVLAVIGCGDFNELVLKPNISEVMPEVALAMMSDGYQLLDVRYGEEFEDCYLQGALLYPLNELHERIGELSGDGKYLIYCSNGLRSRVAALMLSQRGISASVIAGGVRAWPYDKNCL